MTELIRSLPKQLRTRFVPAPDVARAALARLDPAQGGSARGGSSQGGSAQAGPRGSLLDVLSAEALRGELLELWTSGRIPTRAILMVTHSIEEAVFMADRIVVMAKDPGRILTRMNVGLRHPRNRKDVAFQAAVDRVYAAVAGRPATEAAANGTAPGAPGATRPRPRPRPAALAALLVEGASRERLRAHVQRDERQRHQHVGQAQRPQPERRAVARGQPQGLSLQDAAKQQLLRDRVEQRERQPCPPPRRYVHECAGPQAERHPDRHRERERRSEMRRGRPGAQRGARPREAVLPCQRGPG